MLGCCSPHCQTAGYSCGVLGSVASVALYNFFLTEPRLTFHAYDPGYQITFVLMLTSAIITCALTTRQKDHAKCLRRQRFVQKYCLIQISFYREQKARKKFYPDSVPVDEAAEPELDRLPEQNGDLGSEQIFEIDGEVPRNIFFLHRKKMQQTDVCQQRSVRAQARIATRMQRDFILRFDRQRRVWSYRHRPVRKPLDAFENSVLLSILGEGALASKTAETRWKRSKLHCRQE